jgi:hypothetical protein
MDSVLHIGDDGQSVSTNPATGAPTGTETRLAADFWPNGSATVLSVRFCMILGK